MARSSEFEMSPNRVFNAVAPTRQSVLTLLLAKEKFEAEKASFGNEEVVDKAVAELAEGARILTQCYGKLLSSDDFPSAQAFNTAHKSAIAAFDPLQDLIMDPPPRSAEALAWAAEKTSLDMFYLETFEPAITEFLKAGLAAVDEDAERNSSRARREASLALKEVKQIGASIRMVAVNASVEASRAGHAGSGFAVIAGETQSLAGRMSDVIGTIAERLNDI